MAVDPAEVLTQALADFGLPAQLADRPVTVLFSPAPSVADYALHDQRHPGPSASLAAVDAAGLDCSGALLVFGAAEYRVVRSAERHGTLTLFLREA